MHALALLPINQHMTFEVHSFTNFKDMTRGKIKKNGSRGIRAQCVTTRLALDIFYLHTKFRDSCCSRSGDMIVILEIKNALCDPDHAPGVVCHL